MIKAIVLIFLKLSYLGKSLITLMLSLFDDIIRFFDEIGFVIINSLRSIRFEEIRDYIVNNYLTILLFIILIILLYSTIKKENKYEEN
tara:strand:- start:423 stop:686 length:264 start_codon:yes stop_codon:yes gene_type:complete